MLNIYYRSNSPAFKNPDVKMLKKENKCKLSEVINLVNVKYNNK